MAKKKTHEEYVDELAIKNPNTEVVGRYVGAKTPIIHKCIIHNFEWKAAPVDILRGHNCPECKKQKIRESRLKTHEEYVKELKDINPNISVLGEYIDSNTPILHKCKVDGHEWNAQPNNILYGFGCPKCSKRFRRSHEDYVHEAFVANPNIEVVGKFNGLRNPIMHRCKLHEIEWATAPQNILRGHGCWECGKDKIGDSNKKSHEQYVEELKEVNPDIIVLDIYQGTNVPILHRCLIDNYEWLAQPTNILSGRGCPRCNESKGERQIRQWLNENNIAYEQQKSFEGCCDIKSLPFDFYLPSYNLCIEYDGEQHYRSVDFWGGQVGYERRTEHDNIKTEYCKNNGILLLRIPYFKNIEEELNNFLFI